MKKSISDATEYFNNTKVSTVISTVQGLVDTSTFNIRCLKDKSVLTAVDLKSDENITLSCKNVSPFDLAVMDAVYSISKNAGNDFIKFTPESVARMMAGNNDIDVTPQKKALIIKSLDKLRHIDITIDATNELVKRGCIPKGATAKYMSYLLPLDKAEVNLPFQKKTMEGYVLLRKPALYDYAEKVGQVISAPMELLKIEGISVTEESILIRDYLFKRISVMKHNRNCSNRIALERFDQDEKKWTGLFPSLGYNEEYQESCNNWRRRMDSFLYFFFFIAPVYDRAIQL